MRADVHVICPIALPIAGLEELRADAAREGYAFLDRLAEEWASGANRFDGPGEVLCGCLDRGDLVAVGGLNRDPFLDDARIGRIRRVYVRPAWRNQKVGTTLVVWLVDFACQSFEAVRLRAENPGAARLYERLGFTRIDDAHATHILRFDG
jgi:GNAT superfamily N-acetyltransferase